MSANPRIETEEDIQLIKKYTLLPILLDMLARDRDELTVYRHKVVYNHVIYYLKELEASIFLELRAIKNQLKQRDIKILNTDANAKGIDVEYKVRGYIHNFSMLRSLVTAELMTLLMTLRRN